jgi:hypothetical protein
MHWSGSATHRVVHGGWFEYLEARGVSETNLEWYPTVRTPIGRYLELIGGFI